jgi:hypothetical protein
VGPETCGVEYQEHLIIVSVVKKEDTEELNLSNARGIKMYKNINKKTKAIYYW